MFLKGRTTKINFIKSYRVFMNLEILRKFCYLKVEMIKTKGNTQSKINKEN